VPDGKTYDVFLSHNSVDKPLVELLARRLEDDEHLRPFLDTWHLVPGNPWQEEVEDALNASSTCAVFIGPSGVGPWHNEELRSALDDRATQLGFRVIPVLLPGATLPERGQLPRFLRRLTWVDFRGPLGVHDTEGHCQLICTDAIPGRGRGVSPLPSFRRPGIES
jgi:hypothetical protein